MSNDKLSLENAIAITLRAVASDKNIYDIFMNKLHGLLLIEGGLKLVKEISSDADKMLLEVE